MLRCGCCRSDLESVAIDGPATTLEPSGQARSHISGQLELDRPSSVLLDTECPGSDIGPRYQVADLDLHQSQPRTLLSIARSKSARPRRRPSRSQKQTAQCFCVKGRLMATVLPAFHAGRHPIAGSYCKCPIVVVRGLHGRQVNPLG